MAIEVASAFARKAAVPIDEGSVVADLTARDAIESGIRYEGLVVYVESEETNFQLVGGITNDDWEELSGSGSMGEFPTVSGIDERDAIPLEQRAWGKLFYDLQQLKYWYMPGGADLEDNDYWQALGKPVEWSYTFTGPSYGVSFGNDPIHYIRVDTDGGPQAVDLQNGKPQQIVFLKGTSDTNYPILSKSHVAWTHLPADIEIKNNVLVQLYWDQDEMRWIPVGGVGVGGGAGATNTNHEQTNLVPNPRGAAASTADWEAVTYSAASKPSGTPSSSAALLTLTSEADSLSANGSTRFRLSKASGNAQGQAVEVTMPIPEGYQASVLSLDILYKTDSADFIAGNQTDYSSLIFYCAQSSDGTNFTMLEPSSFKLLSKDIPDTLRGYVQVAHDTTHLKLIAYVSRTETEAWGVDFEAGVSKTSYAFGTIVTDWQDYNPTISAVIGAPTNYTIVETQFMRVGDSIKIKGAIDFTGASSSFTNLRISTPPGVVLGEVSNKRGGVVAYFNGDTVYAGLVRSGNAPSTEIDIVFLSVVTSDAGAADDPVKEVQRALAPTSGHRIIFTTDLFKVKGWSSGAQLADGYDGRVISGSYTWIGSTAIASATPTKPDTFTTVDESVVMWDGTSKKLKIKSNGEYVINPWINFAGNTPSTAGTAGVNMTVNGGSPLGIALGTYSTNNFQAGISATTLGRKFKLKAGDELEFYAFQNSGASSNLSLFILNIHKIQGSSFMSPTAVVAARCRNSATQSVNNATTATLVANTIEHDTHGMITTGASTKATIQEAGLYEFKAQVDIDVRHNAAAAFSHIFIKKNGTDILCDKYFEAAADEGAAIQHDLTADGDAFLGAGDELTAEYTNGSGNTATVKLKAFSIKKGK